ncbi:MAG: GAF domain-containing protein [Deltaproteobacteria bacterium]|nr:GAF domain-containing protein [Deltaproteobacteria bacterium]
MDRQVSDARTFTSTTVELAWQKECLGSLSAALSAATEPDQAISQILSSTVQLLRADTATLLLYDNAQGRFRVTAIAGPQAHSSRWAAVAFEIPRDFPSLEPPAARGMRVLPDDDPRDPLVPLLTDTSSRALYVVLRYGAEIVGILSILRSTTLPFDTNDRALARGIGDQAALALTTARMQDDLLRARASRSEVIGIISHEFRSPLSAILGFTELLRQAAPNDGETASYVARIEDAGRSLLEVVEDILAFGNLVTANAELDLKPVGLRELWTTTYEACERLCEGSTVVLDWSHDVADVTLITDAVKLRTVLSRLVGNALKFTERGRVSVEAWVRGRGLVVRVTDTGSGIPTEDRERIFEPFWQADTSTTRHHGGMGLGLYVAQRYVAILGGTITVQSGEQGSVFTVILPNVVDQSSDSDEQSAASRALGAPARRAGATSSTVVF